MSESTRDAILRALTAGSHQIDADEIRFFRDHSTTTTALHQLCNRLEAALAPPPLIKGQTELQRFTAGVEEYRRSGPGAKPCCGFPVGGPCPDCPDADGVREVDSHAVPQHTPMGTPKC